MSQQTQAPYVSHDVLCPRCQRVPQRSIKTGRAFLTHICFQNCAKIYWTLAQCPACTYHEKTVFISEPKLGQLIQCTHCSIAFYLFTCPQKQCRALFYKSKDSYIMGQSVSCETCQYTFKETVCECGQRQVFPYGTVMYEGQHTYNCELCHKPIVYTNCRHCEKTNYHREGLELGQKYKCSHCYGQNEYIPCPTCGRSTPNSSFGYGKHFQCQFCNQGFQFSSCTACSSPNYHKRQDQFPPMKTCINQNCKINYCTVGCQKCLTQVQIPNYKQNEGREENCPNCKADLKFYHCQKCNKFNTKNSKCPTPSCPIPSSIKSYSREAEEKKKEEDRKKYMTEHQKKNENYKEKECKICFNADSTMANKNCCHVAMCQTCLKACHITEKSKPANRYTLEKDIEVPCIICKTKGKYEKVIKYIYQ